MTRLYRLKNQVKYYNWGSPDWIPRLLGKDNPEKQPWAELWMGVHAEGPSSLEYEGACIPLSMLINQNPRRYLGENTEKVFGTIPFLFKVLAAGRPLSIQAHPTQAQAQIGFERENAMGIPLKAPNRNYKDANHKPEILCALTPFTAMCGFKKPADIDAGLTVFAAGMPPVLVSALDILREPLQDPDEGAALSSFLKALFGLSFNVRSALSKFATCKKHDACNHVMQAKAHEFIASFARLYPCDPAIIAPLYLNVIELKPGEAVYLPSGVLHAYIKGLGVELMANSDNVLRGGLTSKHIAIDELLRILRFSAFKPQILTPQGNTYQTSSREFALSVLSGNGQSRELPICGPAIVIVTEGAANIDGLALGQGDSAFIPADVEAPLAITGTYTLYSATPNLSA
ncbi:MAG: mannose-6-phosphate isomerase, class I [Treponema sp.]|jgi:mannose-6-phosphate isomerase|nr:mannose-6-phosphate isomerase, class I [Treponema sp.]